MNIVLNLQPLQDFLAQPPDRILFQIYAYYGWLLFAIMYLFAVKKVWLIYNREHFAARAKYILLAIDIPRGNTQSPKAVENMLAYLAGGHASINWFEKWWEGKIQLAFSLEIVSIDGYTQFIIRTPIEFRSLVESAVYSQYPDAEIYEVDDYTEGAPMKFPNSEYDIWGGEFLQAKNHMYPIKLYQEFEHQMGPDETYYKDPMASLMDLCSSLQPGEQLWYQILLIPTGFDWTDEADKEVDKVMGGPAKVSAMNKFIDWLSDLISDLSEVVIEIWPDAEDNKSEEKKRKNMMELTPKEKKQVEGLHGKASKLGFLDKIRVVYLAKKEVYNPKKVGNGFVGYIKQFAALDLNNIKPDMDHTITSTTYFSKIKRLERRKRKLMFYYIKRSGEGGLEPRIYNVEELASIWHFPIEANVKAPLVQKTPGKKTKPPMSLPTSTTQETIYDTLEPQFFTPQESPISSMETKLNDGKTTEIKVASEAIDSRDANAVNPSDNEPLDTSPTKHNQIEKSDPGTGSNDVKPPVNLPWE